MYFTYVLMSKKDNRQYVGYTRDLSLRLLAHNNGEVVSTKNRRPLELIYYEACLHQQDATKREKYLKHFYGKMFPKNRLKRYFNGKDFR